MRRAKWAGLAGILCLLVAEASAQGPQRMGPGRHAAGDGPRHLIVPEDRPGPASRGDADPRSAESRGNRHRLSAEERLQLRRDVHEAGRDLYPGRMMPRHREAGRE